jgi:hypothetical protein
MERSDIMEVPIYGISEAAQYLRVPLNTLRYWTREEASATPLVQLLEGIRPDSHSATCSNAT